jgi:hypothetical protein
MRVVCRFCSTVLVAALSVVLAGCEGDNGVGAVSRPFSVRFSDDYFRDGRGWVVVHTAGGDSSVSAVQVTEDGVVDLSTSGSRATFTIAKITPPRIEFGDTHVVLTSYMDVPAGTFVARGVGPAEPVGWADVTITYPPALYTDRLVSVAGSVVISPSSTVDSTLRTVLPLYRPEPDGTTSIYAAVQDSLSGYGGWLLDQSFLPGDTQQYAFRLDHLLRHHIVTSSRPLEYCGLDGYRGSLRAPYGISMGSDQTGLTTFDLLYGVFPVSKWTLWGIGVLSSPEWQSAERISSSVPSSLTMPEMSVTSDYDFESDRFTDITVMGTADILMCAWHGYLHSLSGDMTVEWEVWTSPGSHSVGAPALPDSVRADLGFPLDLFEPDYQFLWNFEPAEGFDALARKIYLSDAPWAAQFNDLQAYSRPFLPAGQAAPEQVFDPQIARSDDPATMRLRHHQFR